MTENTENTEQENIEVTSLETPQEEVTQVNPEDVAEETEAQEEVIEVGTPEWIQNKINEGIESKLREGNYVSQEKLNKIVSKRLNRDRKQRRQPPVEPTIEEKNISDFDGNLEQFQSYLVDNKFKQRDYAKQKASYETSVKQEEYENLGNQWQNKIIQAQEKHPDINEKLESARLNEIMSDEHATDLIHSENGGEIAYFLANNLQEAEKYSKLNDRQRLMYLARMSIIVENDTTNESVATNTSQTTPNKAVSKAPAPTGAITPNPNGGSQTDLSKLSAEDFSKLRAKQRRARNGY